jgi:hypothetical protein
MMSLFNFGVLGGINLASPIAGGIIDNLGLTACFNIAGGFGIFLTIFCFLFMPETSFHRSSALAIDSGSHDNLQKAVQEEEKEKAQAAEVARVDSETGAATQTVVGKRQSFWKDLRLFVISSAKLSNIRVIVDTTMSCLWQSDHSVSRPRPLSFGQESCSVST